MKLTRASPLPGTIEILRLAGMTRIKPVYHVSTTSVYDDPAHQASKVCMEDDQMISEMGANLEGGYPQSKWVAERVIMAARKLGIPTSIFRPGSLHIFSSRSVHDVSIIVCSQTRSSANRHGQSHINFSPLHTIQVTSAVIACAASGSLMTSSVD